MKQPVMYMEFKSGALYQLGLVTVDFSILPQNMYLI